MGYGQRIKNRREELGMTQDELAKACGYKSRASISKIESEETDLTQTKLAIIARALHTTPGTLCEPDELIQPLTISTQKVTNAIAKAMAKDNNIKDFIIGLDHPLESRKGIIFANNLEDLMDCEDISNTELAESIGVSISAVGKWLSGTVIPRPSTQFKIADYFGIKRDDLFDPYFDAKKLHLETCLNYKNRVRAIRVKEIPLLGTIAAGAPILAEEHIEEYIALSVDVKADFALKVRGDSMIDANIHDGDIVFIHQQPTVENGEIAAVMLIDPDTSDGVATLKRVYKTADGMQLVPENKKYAPIIINSSNGEGAKILGKATYYITRVN